MIAKNKQKEIIKIWKEIVNSCESYRIKDGLDSNLYINPIVKKIYLRESAFVAKVLATNYKLTQNEVFRSKAEKTIHKVENKIRQSNNSGLEEPYIYPRKVIMKKGSIPATIICIHALKEAKKLLNNNCQKDFASINKFISSCYYKGGYFSHNSLSNYQNKIPLIINTSAINLSYLYDSNQKIISNNDLDLIIKRILNSQRSDGFWPYFHQNKFDKFVFELKGIIPSKIKSIYSHIKGDGSIFFGDYLHHMVTIYYLVSIFPINDSYKSELIMKSIKKGLFFIERNSIKSKKTIKLDYSWEPTLKLIRHCNFYDTSAYFYLLALSIKGRLNCSDISDFFPDPILLFNYISKNLVLNDNFGIKTHEPCNEEINLIMPRPAESIFDKAFLFSFLVDNLFNI